MKPICESIGIDWEGQRQRIMRHPVLNSVAYMIKATAEDGKLYEMLMLPIKYLNVWLFGIEANRVNSNSKDLVIEYQKECFDVLADHFMPKPQYGLKSLPPSPYISEAEAAQFRKSIEAYCKSDSKSYPILYRKVYEYYGITSYKHIPAGKLEEAAQLCGMKLLPLVKSRLPKAQEEPSLLTFTPEELETLVADRVKALEGEVMPKPEAQQTNSITINLAPLENRKPRRWLITQSCNEMVVMFSLDDNKEVMTREQFIKELQHDNHIVAERTAEGVRSMVMDYLPIQVMPVLIEAAMTRMQRCNWQMPG